MNNNELLTKLLWLLQSSRFEKWYGLNGNFDRYISGDMEFEEKITHEEATQRIRGELAKMLGMTEGVVEVSGGGTPTKGLDKLS